MNYLAHLYLSDSDPESLVGSLMGDFVKGRIGEEFEPSLRQGILLHRKIDTYTDSHPLIRRSKARISPEFRRYAGILVDIFFDHFLATQWNHWSDTPLDEFASAVYDILRERQETFPERMQRSMRYMVSNRLLQSYRKTGGVHQALRGIETRLRRPSRLGDSISELEENYEVLSSDFEQFFPLLIDYVQTENSRLSPGVVTDIFLASEDSPAGT
ncbi:MAG: ACP phosphodiesterase [Chromatiales bacterium]|jgi:acyl carrier protein phosphodiesterase